MNRVKSKTAQELGREEYGTYFSDVGDFHEKFDLPRTGDGGAPAGLDRSALVFRIGFLIEELAEFCDSTGLRSVSMQLKAVMKDLPLKDAYVRTGPATNLCEAADALADLTYVTLGTAHMMRLPFEEVWAEVQRANMSKERASGAGDPRSKRGSALDVVKPAGWTAPNHESAITAALHRSAR